MTTATSASGAAAEVRTALREAGLNVGVTGDEGHVQLDPLRPSDARQLARLIRTGTKRTLKERFVPTGVLRCHSSGGRLRVGGGVRRLLWQ
ncbi:hypothetical protein ACFWCQ_34745, partial [Streptomyces cyaneofuscatus]